MSNPKPLEGVKVVELATFIAAPCCCRFLADLGAEVTKIEAPKGDQLRFTAVNEGRPYGDGRIRGARRPGAPAVTQSPAAFGGTPFQKGANGGRIRGARRSGAPKSLPLRGRCRAKRGGRG